MFTTYDETAELTFAMSRAECILVRHPHFSEDFSPGSVRSQADTGTSLARTNVNSGLSYGWYSITRLMTCDGRKGYEDLLPLTLSLIAWNVAGHLLHGGQKKSRFGPQAPEVERIASRSRGNCPLVLGDKEPCAVKIGV